MVLGRYLRVGYLDPSGIIRSRKSDTHAPAQTGLRDHLMVFEEESEESDRRLRVGGLDKNGHKWLGYKSGCMANSGGASGY